MPSLATPTTSHRRLARVGSDGQSGHFQLDLECLRLELRNSLIFDYLWIPEEVPLDLLSRSLTLSRGASGFWIWDFAPFGAHLGRKQMWGLDFGFWIL